MSLYLQMHTDAGLFAIGNEPWSVYTYYLLTWITVGPIII